MDKNEKDIKSEVSALQFVDQGVYQSALQYVHWNAERDAFLGQLVGMNYNFTNL